MTVARRTNAKVGPIRSWTEDERDYLRAAAGMRTVREMAQHLGRRPSQVIGEMQHLGITVYHTPEGRARFGMSAVDVGVILGVHNHRVIDLLEKGQLAGHRSGVMTGRHRVWRIGSEDLATFLRQRPELYDRSRITAATWRAIAAEARPRDPLVPIDVAARRIFLSPSGVRFRLRDGDLQGVRVTGANGRRSWWVFESSLRAYEPPVIVGRGGLDPDRAELRKRNLAQRPALQERYERGGGDDGGRAQRFIDEAGRVRYGKKVTA